MSRLVMSVVSLAMGLWVEQKCKSCSDGSGNSNNNMVHHFYLLFLLNPFISLNSSSDLTVITISDKLSTENDASLRNILICKRDKQQAYPLR